ncbi:EamA family transporter [Eubacteriaceae bacterium ES2]|nr:EamA family transporter [Eubacteriaceae bacterium ES2]
MQATLYIPMIVIILANVMYHNLVKITPPQANAYLSLSVAYAVAMVMTFAIYLFSDHKLGDDFLSLNPCSYLLGFAIVGIELGYIFLYRNGFKISSSSLIANIAVAALLIIAGVFFYKEQLSIKQIFGILLCLGGFFFIKG